jgi:hypothetical protein
MKRIIIAAISGCVIIFIWGAFSHMVLLIGTGFTLLPNEDSVIKTLESSIPKKGLYLVGRAGIDRDGGGEFAKSIELPTFG